MQHTHLGQVGWWGETPEVRQRHLLAGGVLLAGAWVTASIVMQHTPGWEHHGTSMLVVGTLVGTVIAAVVVASGSQLPGL